MSATIRFRRFQLGGEIIYFEESTRGIREYSDTGGWPDSLRKDDFQRDLDDMQSRWQMEGADKLRAFFVEQNMAREAEANAAAAQRKEMSLAHEPRHVVRHNRGRMKRGQVFGEYP